MGKALSRHLLLLVIAVFTQMFALESQTEKLFSLKHVPHHIKNRNMFD